MGVHCTLIFPGSGASFTNFYYALIFSTKGGFMFILQSSYFLKHLLHAAQSIVVARCAWPIEKYWGGEGKGTRAPPPPPTFLTPMLYGLISAHSLYL